MKKLYIFAGVNGAGKSTLYVNKLIEKAYYGARINSDEIVRDIGDWRSEADQNRAAKTAINLRKFYLKQGFDFNVETTLSGRGIVKFIEQANNEGYHIVLYYVGLSSLELSKQRVAIRVSKNGHDIKESVLKRRYSQSFENLAKVISFCSEVYIYDNSEYIASEENQNFKSLKLIAKKEGDKIIKICADKIEWLDSVLNNFINFRDDLK